jgi:hypothetical protein
MDVDGFWRSTINLAKFVTGQKRQLKTGAIQVESLATPPYRLWHRERHAGFLPCAADMKAAVIDVLVRPVVSFDQLQRGRVAVDSGGEHRDLIHEKNWSEQDVLDKSCARSSGNCEARWSGIELTPEENLLLRSRGESRLHPARVSVRSSPVEVGGPADRRCSSVDDERETDEE